MIKFFGGEKINLDKNENLKLEAENEILIAENNELKLRISSLQSSTEKEGSSEFKLYKENAFGDNTQKHRPDLTILTLQYNARSANF